MSSCLNLHEQPKLAEIMRRSLKIEDFKVAEIMSASSVIPIPPRSATPRRPGRVRGPPAVDPGTAPRESPAAAAAVPNGGGAAAFSSANGAAASGGGAAAPGHATAAAASELAARAAAQRAAQLKQDRRVRC